MTVGQRYQQPLKSTRDASLQHGRNSYKSQRINKQTQDRQSTERTCEARKQIRSVRGSSHNHRRDDKDSSEMPLDSIRTANLRRQMTPGCPGPARGWELGPLRPPGPHPASCSPKRHSGGEHALASGEACKPTKTIP